MSSRKDFRLVVDTYNFFYKTINKKENNVLKMFPSRIKAIENFIEKFKNEFSVNFLQKDILDRYFEWSFNYWLDKENSKYGNKGIQIEWIISNASITRWKQANKKYVTYILGKTIRKKFNYEKRKGYKENWDNIFLKINPLEEIEKEKFHNTQKGYMNCSIFTTLYNHKSSNCLKCKYSINCKDNLKNEYPKLFKKRGYE